MQPQPMSISQQTGRRFASFWDVARGTAIRLTVGAGTRCLTVAEGRLWLTCTGTRAVPAEDIWLEAGDELLLPAGTEWVIEAACSGRFQLLVPPQRASWRPWHAGWVWLSTRWRAPVGSGALRLR